MNIILKNLADDIEAVVKFDGENAGSIFSILPDEEKEITIISNEICFELEYKRDFSVYAEGTYKLDKLQDAFSNSIGNAIVQINNIYTVTDLTDGDIITLNDKAHYVPTTKRESRYKCLPAIYYFGEAECERAKIQVNHSICTNRNEFLKLYKWIFRAINLNGWFRILKYIKQNKRQKTISDETILTSTFQKLYELDYKERAYQFKPLLVITDKLIENILAKLPKKLRIKAKEKINKFKTDYDLI
ncbi:MAG: hypothetical protein NC213_08465 [Acetobacter sp.]|nr:hypothetical protein [Bacteroides sp.]MCM1341761.1 hypothetical protein [Acetobacter sp.]MCM1433104.1 hypothetical protein [Clostridiales bacterium]